MFDDLAEGLPMSAALISRCKRLIIRASHCPSYPRIISVYYARMRIESITFMVQLTLTDSGGIAIAFSVTSMLTRLHSAKVDINTSVGDICKDESKLLTS